MAKGLATQDDLQNLRDHFDQKLEAWIKRLHRVEELDKHAIAAIQSLEKRIDTILGPGS